MLLFASLTRSALFSGTKHVNRVPLVVFYSKSTYKGFNSNGSSKHRGNGPKTSYQEISPYIGVRKSPTNKNNTRKNKESDISYEDYGHHDSRYGFYGKYSQRDNRGFSNFAQARSNKNKAQQNQEKPYNGARKVPKSSQSSKQSKRLKVAAVTGEEEDESETIKLNTPDWSTIEPVFVNKNIYEPIAKTTGRCQNVVDDYCRMHNLNVEGETPKPIFDLDELNGTKRLTDNISSENIDKFTPFQSYGIPIALSGNNLIGVGQMRSGKKLAVLLPAIMHISKQSPSSVASSPTAVILVASTELAEQFQAMARALCDSYSFQCHVLPQNQRTPKAPQIYDLLLATPDTLYASLLTESVDLHRCSYFAYYEFDRMLDMAMDEEIEQIHTQLRPGCQKILLTTQWNGYISNYAFGITNNFVRLTLETQHLQIDVNANAKHVVKISEETHKKQTLIDIVSAITKSKQQKTLIFTETKQRAHQIIQLLRRSGFNSIDILLNDRTKKQHEQTLDAFDNDRIEFLVLTDVAARYRTFRSVRNVVSYDMPFSMTDFQLRLAHCSVDRAADALHGITAYTIFSEENGYLIDELITMLHKANQPIEPGLHLMRALYMESSEQLAYALPCQDSDGIQVFRIKKDS